MDVELKYKEANSLYIKGKLTKALILCNKVVDEGCNNSDILNLKGLLLYLNGDLDDAIDIWKLNCNCNNDKLAKIYVKNALGDKKLEELYFEIEKDIENLKIERALSNLKYCAESDFNTIRVNNSIAYCYIHKGDYEKAEKYNNEAFKIDSDNVESKALKKKIKKLMITPREDFNKKVLVAGTLILVIFSGVYLGYNKIDNYIFNIVQAETDTSTEKLNDENINEDSNKDVEQTEIEREDSKEDIIIDEEEPVKEEIKEEEKPHEIYSEDELRDMYGTGKYYFTEGEYVLAIEKLEKAYNGAGDSYLKEHILFFLAASLELNGSKEEGIKYYKVYEEKYGSEGYASEVCYKLAILHRDTDINISKEYAEKLRDRYPDSEYYNDNIKDILYN